MITTVNVANASVSVNVANASVNVNAVNASLSVLGRRVNRSVKLASASEGVLNRFATHSDVSDENAVGTGMETTTMTTTATTTTTTTLQQM